jgi:hypothetical protein
VIEICVQLSHSLTTLVFKKGGDIGVPHPLPGIKNSSPIGERACSLNFCKKYRRALIKENFKKEQQAGWPTSGGGSAWSKAGRRAESESGRLSPSKMPPPSLGLPMTLFGSYCQARHKSLLLSVSFRALKLTSNKQTNKTCTEQLLSMLNTVATTHLYGY